MTHLRWTILVAFSATLLQAPAVSQHERAVTWELDPTPVLQALLEDEDTDGDRKITVHDPFIAGTTRGDKRFWCTTTDGVRHQILGTTRLAYLLEDLTLLRERGDGPMHLSCASLNALPLDRIAGSIRQRFWHGLTRTVDEAGLPAMIRDEKTSGEDGFHLYVPSDDSLARTYFSAVATRHPDWDLRVHPLPSRPDGAFVSGLAGRHGLLSLALRTNSRGDTVGVPFVVPGGRFNELYGWDSFFIILGLLQDGQDALARDIIENQIYEIEHYGAVLNANRSYYLTRSQPPLLTSSVLACGSRMPKGKARTAWLRRAVVAAIREYHDVWMHEDHLLPIGLSRYHDRGKGIPPEVEPGHFDRVMKEAASRLGMEAADLERGYLNGVIHDAVLDQYFEHDRAMRESGHDTSNRLVGLCHDLATVDLNALLYKMETDIARIIRTEFHGSLVLSDGRVERSADWTRQAQQRRDLMNRYLWDNDRGMYFDYNVRTEARSTFESATTFWPLWTGLASREQAQAVVLHALPLLEQAGGISSTSERSRGVVTPERPQRQWDYPNGWAPHQIIAWKALERTGFLEDAQRLAYKWLFTMVSNACDFNGTVTEKYDVIGRTHDVFAEYGNVGARFDYITREGFGWTNASFTVGLAILSADQRSALNRRTAPECVSFHRGHARKDVE